MRVISKVKVEIGGGSKNINHTYLAGRSMDLHERFNYSNDFQNAIY
jgi:hypothetical protein